MKELIINRNRYIIERARYEFLTKISSIFGLVLLLIGLVVIVNSAVPTTISTGSNNDGSFSEEKFNGPGNGESNAAAVIEEDTAHDDADSNLDKISNENIASDDPVIIRQSIPETHFVTKVVDGDTIYVSDIGTRIRLIGVNTPETVDSSKPIQCYGPEASSYLTNLLLHKYVGLESDDASGDVDIYGRPLRYVYYNGENINQKLIQEGYGKEASYGSQYKYRTQFLDSQTYASSNMVGLWSPATCNGQE